MFLDLTLGPELDITLRHFNLVGGQNNLLVDVGIESTESSDMLTPQFKQKIKVCAKSIKYG
jgi:hypothetical protein